MSNGVLIMISLEYYNVCRADRKRADDKIALENEALKVQKRPQAALQLLTRTLWPARKQHKTPRPAAITS
jgi:hypothetical protein